MRGLRNNNPLNLKWRDDIDWYGEVDVATDEDGTFEVFESAIFGIRAGVKNLVVGYLQEGLNTPNKIIQRWAPPWDDNPSDQYARFVARSMGIGVNDEIMENQSDLCALASAMIQFENGTDPYPDWLIAMAVQLAVTT